MWAGWISRFLIPGVAYFLGAVFLAAGVSKLFAFQEFISAVKAYGIFPQDLIPVLAFALLAIEIAVGVASVLLTGFIALAVYSKVLGIEADCGCFGFVRSQAASMEHILQDIILFIFSVAVYLKL